MLTEVAQSDTIKPATQQQFPGFQGVLRPNDAPLSDPTLTAVGNEKLHCPTGLKESHLEGGEIDQI